MCCPFCFGRPFLLNSSGYLSEIAAFVLDQAFGMNIVPITFLAIFASPTFLYHKSQKHLIPPKVGSLQKFVDNFSPIDLGS